MTHRPRIRRRVEAERLVAALARLPDEQRAALMLTYYGNKTNVQVAEELRVPRGTIKSRWAPNRWPRRPCATDRDPAG